MLAVNRKVVVGNEVEIGVASGGGPGPTQEDQCQGEGRQCQTMAGSKVPQNHDKEESLQEVR